MEGRKQAISLRLSTGDIRRIKRLAQRLEVRDSDVVRFAIKTMFARIGPLADPASKGRALVPVFVESGADIVRHFDLDSAQLDTIINEGADADEQVDSDDIQLMALFGAQKTYARLSLRRLTEGAPGTPTKGRASGAGRSVAGANDDSDDSLGESLRRLLYKKYGYSENGQSDGTQPRRRSTDRALPEPESLAPGLSSGPGPSPD